MAVLDVMFTNTNVIPKARSGVNLLEENINSVKCQIKFSSMKPVSFNTNITFSDGVTQ